MTERQRLAFTDLLISRLAGFSADDARLTNWLHHGRCKGADAEAHAIARAHGMRIIGHPPTDRTMEEPLSCDILRERLPYIMRNHAIVDDVVELFAAPSSMREQPRGGTWSTVRYARTCNVLISIVYPDGSIEFSP